VNWRAERTVVVGPEMIAAPASNQAYFLEHLVLGRGLHRKPSGSPGTFEGGRRLSFDVSNQ
jgi:hypothetical protein